MSSCSYWSIRNLTPIGNARSDKRNLHISLHGDNCAQPNKINPVCRGVVKVPASRSSGEFASTLDGILNRIPDYAQRRESAKELPDGI
jgi:hypothetical protein